MSTINGGFQSTREGELGTGADIYTRRLIVCDAAYCHTQGVAHQTGSSSPGYLWREQALAEQSLGNVWGSGVDALKGSGRTHGRGIVRTRSHGDLVYRTPAPSLVPN